jgi:hypothetical protein
MKFFCGFACLAAFLCLLSVGGVSAREGAQAKRALLQVTLQATVTKSWNTLTETRSGGCDVSIHSVGSRKIVLRSARPTRVVVTSGGGRVSYRPAAVRLVRAEVTASGSQTTKFGAPCTNPTERVVCRRSRRVVKGMTFRFVRSRRNEISFRQVRLPTVSSSCPRQSAQVLAIRPGLHQAQGELSERALTNPRVPGQTALASADIDTDFDGDETGNASERVRWSLTFAH